MSYYFIYVIISLALLEEINDNSQILNINLKSLQTLWNGKEDVNLVMFMCFPLLP
jgi:hypothetical protein